MLLLRELESEGGLQIGEMNFYSKEMMEIFKTFESGQMIDQHASFI